MGRNTFIFGIKYFSCCPRGCMFSILKVFSLLVWKVWFASIFWWWLQMGTSDCLFLSKCIYILLVQHVKYGCVWSLPTRDIKCIPMWGRTSCNVLMHGHAMNFSIVAIVGLLYFIWISWASLHKKQFSNKQLSGNERLNCGNRNSFNKPIWVKIMRLQNMLKHVNVKDSVEPGDWNGNRNSNKDSIILWAITVKDKYIHL